MQGDEQLGIQLEPPTLFTDESTELSAPDTALEIDVLEQDGPSGDLEGAQEQAVSPVAGSTEDAARLQLAPETMEVVERVPSLVPRSTRLQQARADVGSAAAFASIKKAKLAAVSVPVRTAAGTPRGGPVGQLKAPPKRALTTAKPRAAAIPVKKSAASRMLVSSRQLPKKVGG
jgi:hypothetical protein